MSQPSSQSSSRTEQATQRRGGDSTSPVTHRRLCGAVAGALLVAAAGCGSPSTRPARSADGPFVLFSQADARAHLTSAPEPAYPILAQAAGVTGAVQYEIDISPEGRVIAARLIHGSPMLEQSAYDTVTRWRFSPFEARGTPVTARTIVTLMFTGQPVTPDTHAALERYADTMLRCTDASRRSAYVEAEADCAKALEVTAGLEAFDRTSDARPLRLYAEALAAQGRHDEAARNFETVETRLRHVPVFALDRTLALLGLGRSLVVLGRDDDALGAWRQTDRQLSEALRGADRDSPFRAEVLEYLQSFLPEYAALLDRINLGSDAVQVRSRVDTLR